MPRTESSNEYERKLLANIESYGWQCTSVGAGDGQPCFSYTIGLFQSFGYPELMIIGLPSDVAHGVLSVAANAAHEGKPLNVDEPIDSLVEGYSCVFVKVPEESYGQYVLSASWYYEGNAFPLYQVVWPSEEGRFPWHARAGKKFRAAQPVVGARDGSA